MVTQDDVGIVSVVSSFALACASVFESEVLSLFAFEQPTADNKSVAERTVVMIFLKNGQQSDRELFFHKQLLPRKHVSL